MHEREPQSASEAPDTTETEHQEGDYPLDLAISTVGGWYADDSHYSGINRTQAAFDAGVSRLIGRPYGVHEESPRS
jgi:hypothetical protein